MKKKKQPKAMFNLRTYIEAKKNEDKELECNVCKKRFQLTEADFAEVTFREGQVATVQYFTCPYCGAIYPYFVSTKGVREKLSKLESIEKKLKKDRNKIKNQKDILQWQKKYKKYLNNKAKLFEEQRKLRSTYELKLRKLKKTDVDVTTTNNMEEK